jgi:hypothetical protein
LAETFDALLVQTCDSFEVLFPFLLYKFFHRSVFIMTVAPTGRLKLSSVILNSFPTRIFHFVTPSNPSLKVSRLLCSRNYLLL